MTGSTTTRDGEPVSRESGSVAAAKEQAGRPEDAGRCGAHHGWDSTPDNRTGRNRRHAGEPAGPGALRGIFGWPGRLHRFVTSSIPSVIPSDYVSLLERPLYGHLGTIRPDDTVQVNPMWFEYDGEHLRFTHTTKRAKFRNLEHNPAMSLSIIDPENHFRYLELRGKLVDVEPDPTGAFYVRLGRRYGNQGQQPPPDSADRVVLVMSIEKSTKQ